MKEFFPDLECICCGERAQYGGVYHGYGNLALCADCVQRGDLRPLGIAIGDAILDAYRRSHPVDRQYTNTIVDSILERLEKEIYRTVADGLYNRYLRVEGSQ